MQLKICTYLLIIACTIANNLLAMEQPTKRVVLSPEKQLAETKGIAWYILSRYGADNATSILPPAVIDHIIDHVKQSIVEQIKQYIPIPCIRTLQSHENILNSVVYNHDNTQRASISDGSIKLYDLQTEQCICTLQCIRTLNGHTGWVDSVAYNHDSTQLASGSGDDRTIKLWDLQSGKCIQTLNNTGWVDSISYNHDSTQLASGSRDKMIRLWDLQSGECIQTLQGHEKMICTLAYNHNSTQLTSGSADKTIKLWNLTTFNKIYNSLDSLTLEQATSLLQHLQTVRKNELMSDPATRQAYLLEEFFALLQVTF